MIYGFLPLLIAFIASAPPRRRCAFPVIAAHSIPRRSHLLSSMMALQFIAAFLSIPETRGVAQERMNERLRMSGRKSSRRNM